MSTRYIQPITSLRHRRRIGAKTEQIAFLKRKGFQIPESLVCISDAYDRYRADELGVIDALSAELDRHLAPDQTYAVRSSANIEDQPQHSFAGQFKSVLDTRGPEGVWQGIWSIWATAESERVHAYLEKSGLRPGALKMAVLIQTMVEVKYAGVAFSKNPLTGLDEIVIEAVEGSGENLVQKGHTPKRWIYKWGTWTTQPQVSNIPRDVIQAVAEKTKVIARKYGSPVDLEWAFDGENLFWLQLRPITSLDVNIYSNRIAREMFPGLIKPLVWSVNVPLVNGAWVKVFTELIGPNDIDPHSLAHKFYDRAYFNMSAVGRIFELLGFPRESLELLLGIEEKAPERPSFKPTLKTYRLLPRMMINVLQKLGFSQKIETFLPIMASKLKEFQRADISSLSRKALLQEIDALYQLVQQTAYYNIVTPLLMQIYNAVLKQRVSALGVDFNQFDVIGELREYQDLLPNPHLAALHQHAERLPVAQKEHLQRATFEELQSLPGLEAFRDEIQQFLARFGHFSDSGNDFSAAAWRENPDLILKMIMNYRPSTESSREKITYHDLKIPMLRRPFFRWIYQRAQRFQCYRERVGSLYTYGYGLLRRYFLQMGENFVRQGILNTREDIFFLTFTELNSTETGGFQANVNRRRAALEANRDISVPSIIFGEEALPVDDDIGDVLEGYATSRGQYCGPVRIVWGMRDFDRVKEGDVLAVPFTDIGWSPLFNKAGAVIAESGGLLSHSSILAREHGIPCIVSIPNVCQLKDGVLVTVDGYKGRVTVHADAEEHAQQECRP